MANKSTRTNFENVLSILKDQPESVFEKHARMLSDLSAERIGLLRTALSTLSDEKRRAFYDAMDETSLNSFEYDYSPIAKIGIEDSDGSIRASSIHVLGFEDSREIGSKILDAALNDPDETAQIAAIEILGQYMYESAIDNRIPVNKNRLHEALEKLIEEKKKAVRQAAVVAYAISETKRVKEIISGFLGGNDREELISGLASVRHSLGEDWDESVLELMRHEDEDVSLEAIRAAGALQLKEALPALYEILSRFDRISPDLLIAAAEAVAEIGDEGSINVLETLGEAVVDMDAEVTDAVDDAIDTINMYVHMGLDPEDLDGRTHKSRRVSPMLQKAIDEAEEQCLSILEEKIPHDLEDDEPLDLEEDEEACDCGEHHHHHHDHDHHHHHDNPLEGMDLSRFRILDDLEAYEAAANRDADEEELWAEFEDMAEEDLDAESLQDFINKLEKKRRGRS